MRAHIFSSGIAVCLLVAATAAGDFQPEAMREKYVVGASYDWMGVTGVSLRDVDGIEGDEVLIGYGSMWHLLRWDSSADGFSQLGFFEAGVGGVFGGGGVLSVRFVDLAEGEGPQVIMLGESGRLGLFDLSGALLSIWTPAVTRAEKILVGDLDQNPGDEILIQTCAELSAWKFGTNTPLWRIPMQKCEALLLGQLDEDPQLELVTGGGNVIDIQTLESQWRYSTDFGVVLTSGDLDGDGIDELVACGGPRCTAYDVASRSTIWEITLPYPHEASAIAAFDVDSDGRAELFQGDSQHGSVRRIDGTTGAILAELATAGGKNFVALGDIDGDCAADLLWARGAGSTAPDTLHLTDPLTMTTRWSSVPEEGGSSGLFFGDLKGTGHPGILWASRAGTVVRFVGFRPQEASSRQLSDSYSPYAKYLNVVTAAQLDDDPALEYVSPAGPRYLVDDLAVYDGESHELEWSLALTSEATVTSLTAADLNGDGVEDILVSLSVISTSPELDTVVAIDGASRLELWRTAGMRSSVLSSACYGCIVEVIAADMNFDGLKEVLALVPSEGIYCFNGQNGEQLWHRKTPGAQGYLPGAWAFAVADIDPSPGAEVIIPSTEGKLIVVDSTGNTVLRETDLGEFGSAWAIGASDLNGDGEIELVLVADAGLVILSADALEVLWYDDSVLPWLSLGNQMVIADIDGDSTMEIAVSSAHSLRVFEYRSQLSDTVPPVFDDGTVEAEILADCCRIKLEWAPAADEASMPVTYRIYRSIESGFTPSASSLVGETSLTSFTDGKLFRGVSYQYVVAAVDAAGNEAASSTRISVLAPDNCQAYRRRGAKRP